MRVPIASPRPTPASAPVARCRRGIFLERAHQPEQQQRHRDRERRVLRVHEHVAVVERAGGEQRERDQAGERAADAAAEPPGRREPGEADQPAGEPARLEQIERQDLGEQRRDHVEAAAIGIEIDERQRAPVGEARAVEAAAAGRRIRRGCSRPSRGRSRGTSAPRSRRPRSAMRRRRNRGRARAAAPTVQRDVARTGHGIDQAVASCARSVRRRAGSLAGRASRPAVAPRWRRFTWPPARTSRRRSPSSPDAR